MNRYKTYIKYNEILDIALTGDINAAKKYEQEQSDIKKHYMYITLVNQLSNLLKLKEESIPKKKVEFNYSDKDIEFLKQFKACDLTQKEAALTGKSLEYRKYCRIFGNFKDDDMVKIEKELNNLNGDFTPRLAYLFYKKTKRPKT